jgi:transposase
MSNPKNIIIKESLKELRKMQSKYGELIGKRLLILIELKKHEKTGISKRNVSENTGINHNSVVKWRNIYINSGIAPFLVHGREGGNKPSIFTQTEHGQLEKKLADPKNGIRGYTELLAWVSETLKKDVLYISLLKYCERHFKTKIKVARKSHVKKDEQAVDTFKKTSVGFAKK